MTKKMHLQGIHYQTAKTCKRCTGHRHNLIKNCNAKLIMPCLRAMFQKSRENNINRTKKQQHTNGTKNICVKGCTLEGARYYINNSSGSLKSSVA